MNDRNRLLALLGALLAVVSLAAAPLKTQAQVTDEASSARQEGGAVAGGGMPADGEEPPRPPRKTPEVRDPARGMYDPHTEREGDARSLEQLSRDRLNLEGKRSRSLEELGSPLRERRGIDATRGRLRGPDDRGISRGSHLRGDEDPQVYTTRPPEPRRVPGEPYGSPSHWRP